MSSYQKVKTRSLTCTISALIQAAASCGIAGENPILCLIRSVWKSVNPPLLGRHDPFLRDAHENQKKSINYCDTILGSHGGHFSVSLSLSAMTESMSREIDVNINPY